MSGNFVCAITAHRGTLGSFALLLSPSTIFSHKPVIAVGGP